MKYSVTIDGKAFDVEIQGDEIRINGRRTEATLIGIPATPLRQLVLGGRSRTFALARDGEHWLVEWSGVRVAARVLDERRRRLEEITGTGSRASERKVVTAPMPGLVLRLEVEEGQHVEAGTGLLVLEAMKMENEITAPGAGTVRRIEVEPGQPVEKGATLVEIAPPEG